MARKTHEDRSASGAADALIDFAIITALKKEREAVCNAFGLKDKHRVPMGTRLYWKGTIPLRSGEYYELVVAQAPDMANIDAAILTNDTIHHWNPGALLMVGIAGSAQDWVALGDLIVGREVYYYERGLQTPGGKLPESKIYPADPRLYNLASTPPKGTAPGYKRPNGSKKRPEIRGGVIASGEKVVADEAFRNKLVASHRGILAIEMEGYGFSAAAWQSFNKCAHLVIKVICDSADRNKDYDWQPYAARTAAGFVRNFLLDRPLDPLNLPKSPNPNNNKAVKVRKVRIEIILDQDFESHNKEDEEELMDAIRLSLQFGKEVTIVDKKRGSVKLTLELPLSQAQALLLAIKAGKLRKYAVVDARLVENYEPDEAPSTPGRTKPR